MRLWIGLLLALLLWPRPALAAPRTLWRIGTFDGSSGEFRPGYAAHAVYRIGRNHTPDWYRFQPGPANGTTGGRQHPYSIDFDLPSVPAGVYRLRVAILYETPRLSSLGLDVNGHRGQFFFHPRLDYRAGDWEGTFVPQTSCDTKTIDLPAAWLKPRHNRFVLTALDAPLVAFGDIVRGLWPAAFHPRSSSMFSWVMNNYWGTNFPAWQGGDLTFRYVITSGSHFDPAALTRWAEGELTPLEHDVLQPTPGGSRLPPGQASLLHVDGGDVTLLTWKQAEDGDGSILRLQENAGHAATVRVWSAYLRIRQAWRCSLREENQGPVDPEQIRVAPFQVLTLRVRTDTQ